MPYLLKNNVISSFQNILADVPGLNLEDSSNPYLGGPKLNVAAKKGIF